MKEEMKMIVPNVMQIKQPDTKLIVIADEEISSEQLKLMRLLWNAPFLRPKSIKRKLNLSESLRHIYLPTLN